MVNNSFKKLANSDSFIGNNNGDLIVITKDIAQEITEYFGDVGGLDFQGLLSVNRRSSKFDWKNSLLRLAKFLIISLEPSQVNLPPGIALSP